MISVVKNSGLPVNEMPARQNFLVGINIITTKYLNIKHLIVSLVLPVRLSMSYRSNRTNTSSIVSMTSVAREVPWAMLVMLPFAVSCRFKGSNMKYYHNRPFVALYLSQSS